MERILFIPSNSLQFLSNQIIQKSFLFYPSCCPKHSGTEAIYREEQGLFCAEENSTKAIFVIQQKRTVK